MIRFTRSIVVLLLTASAMVSTPSYASSGLSGYWQHESEPIWIEMQPDEGKGVMLRNDNATITIKNSGPFRSNILHVDWFGDHQPKARRI